MCDQAFGRLRNTAGCSEWAKVCNKRNIRSIYLSQLQATGRRANLLVRSGDRAPETLIPAIREVISAIKPMPAEFELYSQVVRVSLARERLSMALLTAFGIVALVLATIGIYGVMSYSVARRTGEIAVRAALGASGGQLLALVIRRGSLLGLIGIVIGAAAAVGSRQVIASELHGVSTLDWHVFLLVPVAVFAVVVLASLLPARRAASVDPATMLRTE